MGFLQHDAVNQIRGSAAPLPTLRPDADYSPNVLSLILSLN